MSFKQFAVWLTGNCQATISSDGWSPDDVAAFVPWPKRKPAEVQKLDAPTVFVPTRYERWPGKSEVFAIVVSPSFGTGYSFTASGDEKWVDKLTLRLEGVEEQERAAAMLEFIDIAGGVTRQATASDIPANVVAKMRNSKGATFDYSTKDREIGSSGHGFNFSDFAAVAHEPYFRALVFEVFAPRLAKKGARP